MFLWGEAMVRIGLIAFFVATSFLRPAYSLTPPPTVTVVAEGIGFQYRPSVLQTRCRDYSCTIIADDVEFVVPGDLKHRGATCGATLPSEPTPFVPAQEFIVPENDAVVFRFHSESCRDRIVSIRVGNESSLWRLGLYGMLSGWRVCILTTPDTYACTPHNPDPILARLAEIRAVSDARASQ